MLAQRVGAAAKESLADQVRWILVVLGTDEFLNLVARCGEIEHSLDSPRLRVCTRIVDHEFDLQVPQVEFTYKGIGP